MKLLKYPTNFIRLYKLFSFYKTRKEDTVLNRVHTGHSYLTHFFLLKKGDPPVCAACSAMTTVK